MKHRVAQALLVVAGIGFVVVPLVFPGARSSAAGSHLAIDTVIQFGLAVLCFWGAAVAGRNASVPRHDS